MNDTLVRRSIISSSLARFLNGLRKVNSESLENLDKENYQFQVADSLNSTFEQIKCNLELKKRNLLLTSKEKLINCKLNLSTGDDCPNDFSSQCDLPSHSIPINSTINSNRFINTINSEPSSFKSKYIYEQSTTPNSFTSNNTLDSLNLFSTNDSGDLNLASHIQQSLDSGFSTIQLSNQSIVNQTNNDKLQNLNSKKDEQAFISNLLYFLNLKNENESADNSVTPNEPGFDRPTDNIPELTALSLVKVFSEREPSFKIDPNELDCWLISEDEVPQKLLPIPNNVQFLTQHFNQTNSLISELDENEIDATKNYQQQQSSESNPIDIKLNSTTIHHSIDNSNDYLPVDKTDDLDDDKLIDNERKLLSNGSFLTNNLTTKSMLTDEQDEMQKLNTLFHSGKFLNFSSLNNNVKCRGNETWAAPRAMIHVVIHPTPKRQEIIAKQNYRCCGCGLQVEKQDIPRMLYCYYTGKYFCKYGCHSQTKTIIPAYVINKWSFKLYPVSNFTFQVIQNNYTKPLFNIQDLNPKLFSKVKQLQNLHDLRGQLLKLKDYVITCKKAGNLLVAYLMFEPKHFIESSKDLTYSLEDLVDIKKDCKTLERCYNLVNESIRHIKNCAHCLAKGFFCELCSNVSNQSNRQLNRSTSSSSSRNLYTQDILFPFEIGRVKQCDVCFACYHLNCYASNGFRCVKCVRIERRKSSVLQDTASEVVF